MSPCVTSSFAFSRDTNTTGLLVLLGLFFLSTFAFVTARADEVAEHPTAVVATRAAAIACQAFLFDGESKKLFVGQKGFISCVGGDRTSRDVLQVECRHTSQGFSLRWHYDETAKQLKLLQEDAGESADTTTATADTAEDLCLRIFSFPTHSSPYAVELAACDPQDTAQQLVFVP